MTTLGLLVGNRGFFPAELCEQGRKTVLAVLKEEGIDAVECSCHVTKELMRVIRVLSRLPTPFRMSVNMVLRRQDRRRVDRVRMDVKDAGFLVIDPDDCVLGQMGSFVVTGHDGLQKCSGVDW